jgi:alpha-D-xyloside xylohydrolase
MTPTKSLILAFTTGVGALGPFLAVALPAAEPEKEPDGIVLPVGGGFLKVGVRADNIIRVVYAKDRAFFTHPSLMAVPASGTTPPWQLTTTAGRATLATAKVKIRVDLATGALAFFDPAGQPILAEKPGGRALTPARVQGEETLQARQQWEPNADESLYGLGQQQYGLMDLKGYDLDLWQRNTNVVVPFLVSSRGYGILWDNPSRMKFGDLGDPGPIPSTQLYDAGAHSGGLTASYFSGTDFGRLVASQKDAGVDIAVPADTPQANLKIHSGLPPDGGVSVRWEGSVEAAASGEHTFRTFSTGGVRLWIDGRLVIDHWRQGWLAWYDLAKVRLEAGRRYSLKLEWTTDQPESTLKLLWKTPSADTATSLWSEAADGIDYYFVYGPELDQVVAGYRQITGAAPMMPRWAFGLWQCRERYQTAQESLDVLAGFRSRGIPIDNIVQDWFYWRAPEWGSHEFDATRFPDPAGWIRTIHDKYHARLMISVWPKFHEGTKNFEELQARGFLYRPNLDEGIHDWTQHRYTFYDAFNPGARKLFWSQMDRELFRKGVDAWWLDATEPEVTHSPMLEDLRSHMNPTALGTGSRVLNAYPLMNSEAVYDGQRTAAPDQRVFILTRSAFAGQQRFGAATWSGDISSTWTALRKQVPAGLGFCLSGIPYWTMDTGGFAVPLKWARRDEKSAAPNRPLMTAEDAEEWRELNTRWFQFGTFTPLLRVHGQFPYREMWQFGGEESPAYQAQLKFDQLRYRMLPYIYSLAGAVTQEGGTILRALVMDFRTDANARAITDEYMFGPALLVNPVTVYQARSRKVYLPEAAEWYDFWTGAAIKGGQTIEAPAPYDSIPVFARAGAIIPFGPELQYTAEKPADPITLYVYAGADGAFTLYEDDGLTYGYEQGAFARIPIQWDDSSRMLRIGARTGSFPEMLKERTFQVILISKQKPVGFSLAPQPDRSVRYRGEAIDLSFK